MAAKRTSVAAKKAAKKPKDANASITRFAIDLKQSGLTSKEIGSFKHSITRALAQASVKAAGKPNVIAREPYVKILYVRQTFGKKIK